MKLSIALDSKQHAICDVARSVHTTNLRVFGFVLNGIRYKRYDKYVARLYPLKYQDHLSYHLTSKPQDTLPPTSIGKLL